MNLVAQEGPVVNERAGTVVLSAGAGCADLYAGRAVILEDPSDVATTADTIEAALELPCDDRHSRAAAMRAIVESDTVPGWMARQLEDLRRIIGGTEPVTPVEPASTFPAAPPGRVPQDRAAAIVQHRPAWVWPVSHCRSRRLQWRRR